MKTSPHDPAEPPRRTAARKGDGVDRSDRPERSLKRTRPRPDEDPVFDESIRATEFDEASLGADADPASAEFDRFSSLEADDPVPASDVEIGSLHDWTLVLNRGWVPVDVTTVVRAICKIYQGAALVIQPQDYSVHDFDSWIDNADQFGRTFLRTSSFHIPVPEVIVLAQYNRVPRRQVSFSRFNLFKRDRFSCQYCGVRPRKDELTIDHVVPRSRGGESAWTNCVVACQRCNSKKGSSTLRDSGLSLRQTPKRPQWSPGLIVGEDRVKESWSKFIG